MILSYGFFKLKAFTFAKACAILMEYVEGLSYRLFKYNAMASRSWSVYFWLLIRYFPLAIMLSSFGCGSSVIPSFHLAGPLSLLYANTVNTITRVTVQNIRRNFFMIFLFKD